MELVTIWFVLIALLWTGYLVLEGFDFGVGMLQPLLTRNLDDTQTETRKRLMLTTIGPHWDGNEVWLITAVGAMFAAFPAWYATLLSAMYLPFLLLLVALIGRNIGLEYRHKRHDRQWLRWCDVAIIGGSFIAPFTVGVILTNLVRGLPLGAEHEFTGSAVSTLNPLSLLGGVTVVSLCLAHGATFLSLKTDGAIRGESAKTATKLTPGAFALSVLTLALLGLTQGSPASWIASGGCVAALALTFVASSRRAERQAFLASTTAIASLGVAYFVMLFPDAIPSTLNPTWSLTTDLAASTPMTLRIMTWAAVVFLPITVGYSAFSYWVFRRRINIKQLAPR